MIGPRVVFAGFGVLAGLTTPGTAQRFTGVLALSAAEHRVDAGAGLEVSRGPLFTVGAGWAIVPRWVVGLDVLAGSLAAEDGAPDRDVAQLRATLRFRTTSWLVVEAGFGTRTYTAAIARQRWTAASLGAELTLPFAGDRIEAVGRIALQPGVSVTGLETPSPAVTAATGVRLRAGAATFAVLYSLERYDFSPLAGAQRHERLSTLTFLATWAP